MDASLTDHFAQAPGDVLGALFQHSPVLALSMDPTGNVRRASVALETALGHPNGALTGVSFDALLAEHFRSSGTGFLQDVARLGRVAGVELTLVDASGMDRPFGLTAFAELDAKGALSGIIAVLEDPRGTREAMAVLDQKALEAEEASAAKSRFLAAMSHEIRTPMNAILGFAQLLEMSDLDETRAGHVQSILSAGNAMVGLLRDLLDLSRVEAGHMQIERRPFDLVALIREIERWWRDEAGQKALTFRVEQPEDLPQVVVSDRTRIQQVLNNYLANAVKFTSQGEVVLGVSVERRDWRHATLRFRVSDTGPGIAPEHVARLYRPFVRIEGQGTAPKTGWGLGLSICASIAEAMDAEVGVETEPGAGATFWLDVSVPLAEEEAGTPSASGNVDTANPGPPRQVLLVEDNPLNQAVMLRLLEGMGHKVMVATNGFDALDIVQTEEIDVLVMDIMMPGLGGVAATRRLREAEHARRDVPVVACSAHVSAEDEMRYRDAGMTAFLPKPVDRGALLATIAQVTAECSDPD